MPEVELCPFCRGRSNPACPFCRGSGLGGLEGFSISKIVKKVVSNIKSAAKDVEKALPYVPAAAGLVLAPFTGGISAGIGAQVTGQIVGAKSAKEQAKAEKAAAELQRKAEAVGVQAGQEALAAGGRAEAWKAQLKTYWPLGLAVLAVGAIAWAGSGDRRKV